LKVFHNVPAGTFLDSDLPYFAPATSGGLEGEKISKRDLARIYVPAGTYLHFMALRFGVWV
jgi:hypothetical protein